MLRRSESDFGTQARTRYRGLIDRAIRDLAEDPERLGVKLIDDVREGYRTYHLRWSETRRSSARVRRPRHLIAFTISDEGDVVVARVFHERQMLARHLRDDG